jgi:hypothetical protein
MVDALADVGLFLVAMLAAAVFAAMYWAANRPH